MKYIQLRAFCLLSLAILPAVRAATVSPLFSRGYPVLPVPQNVKTEDKEFELSSAWRLAVAPSVKKDDVAVEDLRARLDERFHLKLQQAAQSRGVIELSIDPAAVKPDGNGSAPMMEQAYRLTLAPGRISVSGNTSAGLFYGVQTLVQLIQERDGRWWLPEALIEDWPDLELRVIYWDEAHHLDHLDVLKAALRQAAFYKINAFAIKLEGHFQYDHAKPIVEPYAFSPAEFQELTDYGLRYHVQVIPYLDAPSHDAFILKHPEYNSLREYPESNYEFCATNPATLRLFEGMFDDLLAANKGGKYFVLSTDEPYYIGLAKNSQCQEAERAKQLGSVGKLFAEFVSQTAGYLHDRGRTVIFWGEYPMKPDDIAALPSYVVNGEVYGPEYDPVFKAHGIRQLLFTSTVSWTQYLFPNYYLLPERDHLPGPSEGTFEPARQGPGLVAEMMDFISTNPARQQSSLLGSVVAGWADVGIHPETMWLGYVTGSSASWHAGAATSQEAMNSFYRLFYGSNAQQVGRMYQLMSEQAQFWKESWDVKASAERTPFFGDYNIIYSTPQAAKDQTLPELPVPSSPLLSLPFDWAALNAKRVAMAGDFLSLNDELLDLIHSNQLRAQFEHYNLEVYLSIAQLFRHNLQTLLDLTSINTFLQAAAEHAAHEESAAAVTSLDRALDTAQKIATSRQAVLDQATQTWQKSWFPRVEEANGRRFLHKVDDVKDHLPDRTVDMSFLVYRELLYPLDRWAKQTLAVRNDYAKTHNLPERSPAK